MKKEKAGVILAGMGVTFAGYALWLGYDNALIASVFTFLGLVAGYLFGKKTS